MYFKSLVCVMRVSALGQFKVPVPVHLAFGANHYRARVDHVLILAARGSSRGASIRGTRAKASPGAEWFPQTDPPPDDSGTIARHARDRRVIVVVA